MGREIERKFIPINNKWLAKIDASATEHITQGYVDLSASRARIRITESDGGERHAYVYLKNNNADDKREYELEIPIDDRLKSLTDECSDLVVSKERKTCDLRPDDPSDEPVVSEHTHQYDIKRSSTVRVRISTKDDGSMGAQLCIKGPSAKGAVIDRPEIEYPLSLDLAKDMLRHACANKLKKTRYVIKSDADSGVQWTVDKFTENRHKGLFIAEAEASKEAKKRGIDMSAIALPDFIATNKGKCVDVTAEKDFANGQIAKMDQLSEAIKVEMDKAVKIGGKKR